MSQAPIRFFHPDDLAFRLAIVSVQPADSGRFAISVARGASRYALTDSRLYGPFESAALQGQIDTIVDALIKDGYLRGGLAALVSTVATAKKPVLRARAANRLGHRRERAAVDVLRTRAQSPKDDISSVIVALGRIGDDAALPEVRTEAEKKLLSRRRAGAEALRLMGDDEGIQGVVDRALERLPSTVAAAVNGAGALNDDDAIIDAAMALPLKDRGLVADSLYDIGAAHFGGAAARAAVEVVLRSPFEKPGFWRYAKSILKRAIIRGDDDAFGRLLHAFERRSRKQPKGSVATLKSGLDGEMRAVRVFSRETLDWIRKMAWRALVQVARHTPERYPHAAAACLVPYRDTDDEKPRHLLVSASHCFALMRICHGGSSRFVVDGHRAVVKLKKNGLKPEGREESFANLWDAPSARPAVRRLLAGERHRLVLQFALRLVAAHPAIVDEATTAELVAMLGCPDVALAERAGSLLSGRLAGDTVDIDVILALGASENERARGLAVDAVTRAAHRWTRDVEATLRLVTGPAVVREAALRLLLVTLPAAAPAYRGALAAGVLQRAKLAPATLTTLTTTATTAASNLPDDGAIDDLDDPLDGLGELSAVLAAELLANCSLEDALVLLNRNDAGAAIAAVVISGQPDPLAAVGTSRLHTLSASTSAAQRRVAAVVIRAAAATLRTKAGLLLELGEGEWEDVRAAVVDVVEGYSVDDLSVNLLSAIIDSAWPTLQHAGKALVSSYLASHSDQTAELIGRLSQHPGKLVRAYVVDLAVSSLRPGLTPLLRLEASARAILFDTRPRVEVRSRLLAFLRARGLSDAGQGEFVAGILVDVLRSRTQAVSEDALMILTELGLAWPEDLADILTEHGLRIAGTSALDVSQGVAP